MKSYITANRHLSFLLLSLVLLTITPVRSWTQDEVFKNIEQRFEKFSGYSLPEKIYLHTDKNFYLAGEIIWFKIYYVDGVTHQALNLSKVAYVEITDKSNKPVLQAKVALTENGGSGSFYLPLTLNSDNYRLRAYTNWMKNSGPDYFFNKIISVVNTIKPPEGRFVPDSVRVTADFFPEGGNMVQGVETKIAFHIADQYGKGLSAKGIITSDIGDTITHFSPSRFGIGNFTFKPLAGRSYKATVQLPDGRSFSSSLPVVYDNGYVMNVTDNKDGRIKVRVQARSKETGPRGENVFLLAHTRQKLKTVEYGFINYETDLVFYVDKTKLAEGVSHFTLFNKDRQPVCERLVFIRPKNLATTAISTDKPVYEKREKVNLSIDDHEKDKLTAKPDYSVSVFQVDSLQVPDEENIASYLWLSSDLRGQVESPGFYFSSETNTDEAVDNLMLTHGWRRFRWENILGTGIVPTTSRFMPEVKGHLISAKITRIADGKVVRGIDCFLSFPSNPFGLSVAKTDSNGIVSFEVNGYYGPGEIIIQASRETTSSYRVDILIPFAGDNPLQQIPFFSMTRKEEMALTFRSIAMQAQNIYMADSLRRFYTPVMMDSFPFFGKPEFTYRLDDYKRFTTMEEVLREYVSSIDVALRNGKLYMSIFDDALKTVYSNEALVLIDGVPIMDYQKIFSYDPLKVKKLDIVPRRYVLGEIDFKGIASFETYQGKFDGFELTPGVISVDYDGLQLQREFYSPAYETSNEKEKRIPDYRSTLYWTPEVPDSKVGQSSLQFYTSDLQGKFLIVLQGFNANGEPVSATGSFTVE